MKQISNSKPKARKEHQCNYCCNKITIGEVYDSQTNTYDGEIYTWKAHTICSFIVSELKMFEEAGSNGVTEDFFQESINDAYGNFCMKGLIEDTATNFNERIDILKNHFSKKIKKDEN